MNQISWLAFLYHKAFRRSRVLQVRIIECESWKNRMNEKKGEKKAAETGFLTSGRMICMYRKRDMGNID